MARGPFQGTFQINARPTVVTSPDAIVYINGESDIIGCASCRRKFDINKYVTSVQVNLSVDSSPGSASFSLSVPRHCVNDFFFDGEPIITPMMEVEIYAKGYYLVEGLPQYYPIFWGLITEVSDDYGSGEHSVSIQCADILKWWELCKMNVNAAFTAPSGQQDRSIFGNVFYGTNPYDVIWTLAQSSFGDVVVGSGSLINLLQEKDPAQSSTFQASLKDMMLYWESRFRRIRSNLLLYGTNGVAVRGDTLYSTYGTGKKGSEHWASSAVSRANGGKEAGQIVFDPADPGVTAFRTQFSNAGQVNFWQSEYQTKLELATAAKEAIGFEFFMDVTGDLVFKPPFFNLDILGNKPLSWIQDIDIIDWSFSESEAEVVTQITMQGSFGGNIDYGMPEEATPYTTVTDYHLLRKYGWRSEPYNSEFMSDPQTMFYHGLDILDRKNSRRFHGSVTIPMRPELRLGFPVYIASKDQVWYVTGINHNIAFGGRATTQLTLTAKRGKFIAPTGTGTLKYKSKTPTISNKGIKLTSREIAKGAAFELNVGNAATFPPAKDPTPGTNNPYEPLILRHPKTGRIVGYPNAVMVYTRPFAPPGDTLTKTAGQGTKKPVTPKKNQADLRNRNGQIVQTTLGKFEVNNEDALRAKHSNNRYQYGLNSAGVYVYAYDSSKVIGELALTGNIKVVGDTDSLKLLPGATGMIRPVSDDRGFEVIGHFRYGRGVALRDGQLILDSGKNQPASVDVQLALAGGLQQTLEAQSQGITTIISSYTNAADAVTRIQPEDLQTAGIRDQDTGEIKFISTGTQSSDGTAAKRSADSKNFVDSAPLGSAAASGVPASVEAGQLSRALTIAEMSVKDADEPDDADCPCILGRSELAFINVGYQIKTLNSSTPATTVTGGGAIADQTADALNDPNKAKPLAQGTSVPKEETLLRRVDTFLWNLYSALDPDHQREESILRTGSAFPQPETSDATGPNEQKFGDLAPPYSAPQRYVIGDQKAFLGEIESNVKGLDKAFATVGDNIRVNSKKAGLKQKVANEQGDIAKLEAEKKSLKDQIAAGAQAVVGKSLPDQIALLDKLINEKKQDLMNDQTDLNKLGGG